MERFYGNDRVFTIYEITSKIQGIVISNAVLKDKRKLSLKLRLNRSKTPHSLDCIGAGERIRTADFLITSEILYQLSYAGL